MTSAHTAATAKAPVRDPRYLALRNFAVSISVFNILGYAVLGFEQPWLWPILAVLTGYATELALEVVSAWSQRRGARFLGAGPRGFIVFLLPSHITALAVNMLLYVNNQVSAMLFAVFVGVAGKHVLQAPVAGRMRHYMNPSNFGIVVALLCFSRWISIAPPYEFTENANTLFRVFVPLVLVTSGTVINGVLTKRIPLILGWVGGFVIQAFLRHWIWHVALMGALGPMTGVAFALYTNYMITDPGTTPVKARNQFMFGSSVAVAYGVLMLCNVVYTLFFATVVVCGLRGAGLWGIHLVRRAQSRRAGSRAPDAPVGERPGSEAVAA
ncbi:enediyne biosynthesis protein [Streptomyces sp. HPF1205]|uniref:enediyne biosynthesis protein n=1 Tax=Streptomyces sp. HPF1205 TaxID=2873262 RepID=UPI001CED6753|nr:enediyne biosynthesis protein [Streptomyces sp. HPF1205]